VLRIFTIGAFVAAGAESAAYLVTDDGHWMAASLLTYVVGGLAYLNLRLRRSLDADEYDAEPDEYGDGDVYHTDLHRAPLDEYLVDQLDADAMAGRMRALDRNPAVHWIGAQARERDRVPDMPARQRRAWADLVGELQDDDEAVSPW